jgi:Glycosyl hydrolase family 12
MNLAQAGRKSQSATMAIVALLLAGVNACSQSSHASDQAPSVRTARSQASARPAGPVTRMCGQAGWPETPVDHGAYIVQNDEWNSTVPECITTDGGTQFTVTSSSIYEPTNGNVGGYPSIYSGCSAGVCTAGNRLPIRVSDLAPGTITSSWTTTQPRSGAYDVAYDIWFNRTAATSGVPDGGELMIWLAYRGAPGVSPGGHPTGHTTIGGHAYTVWIGPGGPGFAHQVTYVMNRATTSVRDLDVSAIAADAARRGYLATSWYLLNIQAGFELWQGGTGLETNSFTLNVNR